MRPNVLLVVFDTARADALEPYGAPAGSSPAVADLARRGAAWSQVRAAASWTLPSHASMFTGLLPSETGIHRIPAASPLASRSIIEAHAERLLPRVLERAGYATLAVSTNLWITRESGFGPGFQRFESVDSGRQAGLHSEAFRSRIRWDLEGLRARVDDGAARAGELLRPWLAQRRSEPFFCFVNLIECHSPYLPPRPWNDLGPLDRLRAAEEARRHLTLGEIWRACAGAFDVPAEALARMRHLYGRSVRLMDDWLADVLGELDRAGALSDTLVIVTSDHGENFGEGGLMGHAFSLDERLLRVPFVLAGPGAPADPGITSLAGLPRTIAEAIDLEEHPWTDGPCPPGIAIAEFEPPGPDTDERWQRAFADWGLDPKLAGPRVGRRLRAATDGRLKLQLRGGEEELFDLDDDPLELEPRPPSSADPAAVGRLRAALEATGSERAERESPAPAPQPEISDEEREKLEDRMRLLGYM